MVLGIAGPGSYYLPEMKAARQTRGDLVEPFNMPKLSSQGSVNFSMNYFQ